MSSSNSVAEIPPPDRHQTPAPVDQATVRAIIVGIMLAMFLSALEQTIVAPALPTIGRSLSDVENLSWVVTAYLLSTTLATALFGKLSDIYGRRALMLISVSVFVLGSVACALAPTLWALDAAAADNAGFCRRMAARRSAYRGTARTRRFRPCGSC